MHDTSLASGELFADAYCDGNMVVVDLGGSDYNGSLRQFFERKNVKYICVDIAPAPSVDIVITPGEKLPIETGTVDLVVSTSCFEHDPCFWITFKEMCRVTKLGGHIYVNAPSKGPYHKYPGDNWRFYADAGQALAYWSAIRYSRDDDDGNYTVCVHETFFIHPISDPWMDFVCIWKRVPVDEKETSIVLSDDIQRKRGPLRQKLESRGYAIL